jgi:hypothetical protein
MSARNMNGHISFHSGSVVARLALAPTLLLLLAGCALAPSLALSGMDVVSYASSDRSLAGNAASSLTGEECAVVQLADGQSYCLSVEEQEAVLASQKRYCYRTIGTVTCYKVLDPYGDGARLIQ